MDPILFLFALPWFCGSCWAGTKLIPVTATRLDTDYFAHVQETWNADPAQPVTHYSALGKLLYSSGSQSPPFSKRASLLQYLLLKLFIFFIPWPSRTDTTRRLQNFSSKLRWKFLESTLVDLKSFGNTHTHARTHAHMHTHWVCLPRHIIWASWE